jgi:hypothetical protein
VPRDASDTRSTLFPSNLYFIIMNSFNILITHSSIGMQKNYFRAIPAQ